jgi:hypothetical protein
VLIVPIQRCGLVLEDNLTIYFRDIICEYVEWVELALDRVTKRVPMLSSKWTYIGKIGSVHPSVRKVLLR